MGSPDWQAQARLARGEEVKNYQQAGNAPFTSGTFLLFKPCFLWNGSMNVYHSNGRRVRSADTQTFWLWMVHLEDERDARLGTSWGEVLLVVTSLPVFCVIRQWASESGASAVHSDQPKGHGFGCGHLQRSGHRHPGSFHPLCHLL